MTDQPVTPADDKDIEVWEHSSELTLEEMNEMVAPALIARVRADVAELERLRAERARLAFSLLGCLAIIDNGEPAMKLSTKLAIDGAKSCLTEGTRAAGEYLRAQSEVVNAAKALCQVWAEKGHGGNAEVEAHRVIARTVDALQAVEAARKADKPAS